jgi:hypothetical protein
MLFALVVMAGIILLVVVVNNRGKPSRWEGRPSDLDDGGTRDGIWAFGGAGGDSGGDCGGGDGGGCDGGGGD